MRTKIEMFATDNDTNKTVFAIDGFFGFVKNEEEVEEIIEIIGDIDNSWFGCYNILPPNTQVICVLTGQRYGRCKISERTAINIKDYALKRTLRKERNWAEHEERERMKRSNVISKKIFDYKRKKANECGPSLELFFYDAQAEWENLWSTR